jgi:hypothetical protein
MLKAKIREKTLQGSSVARSRMLEYGVAIVSARGYRDHVVFLRFIPGLSSSVAVEYFQEESSYTVVSASLCRLERESHVQKKW